MQLPALSVLDQSTVASGRGADDAIRETLALARACDRLGYARYWLAEHHGSDSHAGSAPEILIGAVAATTSRIRVGSAGVMLPHYSALKVAEQFRVLEAVAPGRIDLGVGRAPGSDGRTAFALNPRANEAADHFPAQLRDLLAWLGEEGLPEGHPFRGVRATPRVPTAPEVWVLGSSDYGAQVAAYFGLPYCFASFITDGRGAAEALALYRDTFRGGAPRAGVAVFALAAPTREEARRLFRSRAVWRLYRDRGIYPPLPSVEEAEAHALTPDDAERVARMEREALIGTAEEVRDRIAAMCDELGVEEVAVLTACHDRDARARSYALLAEAWGLGRPEGVAERVAEGAAEGEAEAMARRAALSPAAAG